MDDTKQHVFMRPATAAMRSERIAFNVFRVATYAVLLAATIIFGVIFIKGADTIFQREFPFINVPFLVESPETLHVFDHEGQHHEMGDREFRKYMTSHENPTIAEETYVYSAGGIFPCIVGKIGRAHV